MRSVNNLNSKNSKVYREIGIRKLEGCVKDSIPFQIRFDQIVEKYTKIQPIRILKTPLFTF